MSEEVWSPNLVAFIQRAFVIIMLVSGVVATAMSIRSTKGPHERAFALRTNTGAWVVLLLVITLAYSLPRPWDWILLTFYVLHLPWAVYVTVKRQLLLRMVDEHHDKADAEAGKGAP